MSKTKTVTEYNVVTGEGDSEQGHYTSSSAMLATMRAHQMVEAGTAGVRLVKRTATYPLKEVKDKAGNVVDSIPQATGSTVESEELPL